MCSSASKKRNHGPWIGLNVSRTQDGRKQIDGACAVLINEKIHAIAEERLSGVKHDGNCWRALNLCLESFHINRAEVEKVTVSTCGEPALKQGDGIYVRTDGRLTLQDLGFEPAVIESVPSHHESHAWEALYSVHVLGRLRSNCLVYVADRVGQPGEHQTLYYYEQRQLTRLARDPVCSEAISGLGEVYDYVTRYLGWEENFDAGKTMALAGLKSLGIPSGSPLFFEQKQSTIHTLFPRAREKAENLLTPVCPPLPNAKTILTRGADLAYKLQKELEFAVLGFLRYWVKRVKPESILFSGGLATNCKLLGVVYESFPDLYVQGGLMPGDTGQGVGNLVGEFHKEHDRLPDASPENPTPLFWPGNLLPLHEMNDDFSDDEKIDLSFPEPDLESHPVLVINKDASSIPNASGFLAMGGILAVCSGALEPGPRALGFHSLLADPRNDRAIHVLRTMVKKRDAFRPFGVIMTPASAQKYFHDRELSPYMDIALKANESFIEDFPAVVHADGTIRIQTLCKMTENSFTARLLHHLEETRGVGVLINTSLNRSGEPITHLPGAVAAWRFQKQRDRI